MQSTDDPTTYGESASFQINIFNTSSPYWSQITYDGLQGPQGDQGPAGSNSTASSSGAGSAIGGIIGALGGTFAGALAGAAAGAAAGSTASAASLATGLGCVMMGAADTVGTDATDLGEQYEEMSLQEAINDLRVRTQNIVNVGSLISNNTTTQYNTYVKGSFNVMDQSDTNTVFAIDATTNALGTTSYFGADFRINQSFTVHNYSSGTELLGLDSAGNFMVNGTIQLSNLPANLNTISSSGITLTGLTNTTSITPASVTTCWS